MDDPEQQIVEQPQAPPQAEQEEKAREILNQKLKAKGAQQISFADYLAMKKKKEQKRAFEIPKPVKIILSTPFLVVFCFGVFFIPFMYFLMMTGQPASTDQKKTAPSSSAKASNLK